MTDLVNDTELDILIDSFRPPFTEEEVEIYLSQIYNEAITKENLSIRYHETVGLTLENALIIGFGSPGSFNNESPQFRLFRRLRESIYVFSAAKQYQQVRTMSRFINRDGVKSTYAEFRKLAVEVFKEYNEQYLKTEYITAIGQSQSAKEWIEAEQKQDLMPYLEYRTQRDSRVRDEHAALDGITLPVTHPFWKTYMPKNGWRCRCFTVSRQKATVTDLTKRDLSDLDDEKKFPPVFRMNPGKDGLIFNPKHHPYFFVDRGDAGLRKQNFNMPIPK